MSNLLDPKQDYIFRNIFGVEKNKKLLLSLLNAILDGNPHINDLTMRNTEISKILKEDKTSRLDVRARTDTGIEIDIEIQCQNTGEIPERAAHYTARLLPRNITSKESYRNSHVIGIWILGENINDRVAPVSNIYLTYQPTDTDAPQIMTECMRIITIELAKFNPKTANLNDMLTAWLSFLKAPEFMDKNYLKNKEVEEAMDTLEYISADDEVREIADLRERTQNDKNSEITTAVENKAKEVALAMKADGLSNTLIAKYLGITEAEVEMLLKE